MIIHVALQGELEGIELAQQLRNRTRAPILHISDRSDPSTVTRAADTNTMGFVLKPFREEQLLSAVAVALSHRPLVDGSSSETQDATPGADRDAPDLGDNRRQRFNPVGAALSLPTRSTRGATELTDRELDIVRLLLSNGRVRSIATALDISLHTVRNHLRSIFRKLDVHSQSELIHELTRHTGGGPDGAAPSHSPQLTTSPMGDWS